MVHVMYIKLQTATRAPGGRASIILKAEASRWVFDTRRSLSASSRLTPADEFIQRLDRIFGFTVKARLSHIVLLHVEPAHPRHEVLAHGATFPQNP